MGVQAPLVMVNAMAVLAVRVAEVPVIITVYVPAAAELLAASVITLDAALGFVPNVAVTPVGTPDAARVTLPLNPPMSVTLMVLVPLLPAATVSVSGAGESVKPGAGVPKVTTTLAATLGTPCAVNANNQ